MKCPALEIIHKFGCLENHTQDERKDVPNAVERENIFLYLYMDIEERTRISIGHQFTDMVRSCTFKGKDCTTG